MSSPTLSLADALLSYEQRNLDFTERLRRLQLDFGMRMGKTALAKLNKQFRIGALGPKHSSLTTHSETTTKPNRISVICDELSSDKPLKRSENIKPPTRTAENARHRRPLHDTPQSTLPEIINNSIHDRWWYAQHADLRLELGELKAGFAVEALSKQKQKTLDRTCTTKRRAFADLSRPTSENVNDML